MKIRHKILIPFTLSIIAFGVFAALFVSWHVQDKTREIIQENMFLLAQEKLRDIDRVVVARIEQAEVYVSDIALEETFKESNDTFEKMEDREAYIEEIDTEWRQGVSPLTAQITENELSEEIRTEFQLNAFYEKRYGHPIFPEVFVTNKFGVNVAQTNATSDYYQADEAWWQETKENGLYISEIRSDESAEANVIDIAVRIEDEEGNFSGVLLVAYDIREVVRAVETLVARNTTGLLDVQTVTKATLLNAGGSVIHSTRRDFNLFDRYEDNVHKEIQGHDAGGMYQPLLETKTDSFSDDLLIHAHSKGVRHFEGLGWILITAYSEEEAFSVASFLRNIIFLTVLIVAILAFIVSRRIAHSIADPIEELTVQSKRLAEGDFTTQIGQSAERGSKDDEIKALFHAFETMRCKLKEMYESLDEKVRERTRSLAEANARNKAMLTSIGDGLIFISMNRQIVFTNGAAENMLGVTQRDMIGSVWTDIVTAVTGKGEVVPPEDMPMEQVLNAEGGVVVSTNTADDFYFTRTDRSTFPVIITASQVVVEGEKAGVIVVFRDITKDKQIDEAKTEFVSLASHQLRTPLSTINWYIEMLLDGDAGPLKKEQTEFLEQVYTSNQRMVGLVEALLNVSRLELGTFAVNPEETDIPALFRSIFDEVKPVVDQKCLDFVDDVQRNIPNTKVDPDLTRMIFENLITNAVKYTPEKGQVRVSAYIATAGEQVDEKEIREDSLVVEVADTGYGIPDNQKDQIFNKLFRADNVQQKDTTGTGLGLYISKLIVDHVGGKIWFNSQENEGTSFFVTLPLSGMRKKKGSKTLGE